jgi:uncharacterized membrane protein
MRVWRHSIWIAKPREQVFDFLFDFEQAPRWRSFVQSMEQIDPGPARSGTRFRVKLDVMGERTELELSLLELERPRLWKHRTAEIDFRGEVEYKLEPESNGTRVTLTGRAKPVTFYGWLAIPLLFLVRGKAYKDQLPRLKQVLEEARNS